jgi:hypothetical protein
LKNVYFLEYRTSPNSTEWVPSLEFNEDKYEAFMEVVASWNRPGKAPRLRIIAKVESGLAALSE